MVSGCRRVALAVLLCGIAVQCHAGTCGPAYGADGIAEDAVGNVWFTHYEDVRISTFGVSTENFTEYLPTTKANMEVTTREKGSANNIKFDYNYDTGYSGVGIDNARKLLWTFRWNSNTLTRFSFKDKQLKDFKLPGKPFTRGAILIDTRGHLWVLVSKLDKALEPRESRLVEVSPEGDVLRQIALPLQTFSSYALALDSQGRLWLAQSRRDQGAKSELYVLQGKHFVNQKISGLGYLVNGMAFDASGNLWLTSHDTKAIAKYSNGKISAIPLPTASGVPGGALVDSKGNLWFTEYFGDYKPGKIGRLAVDGTISEYPVPADNEWVVTMAAAKDGGVWFSTIQNYNLFHLDPATGATREYVVPVPTNWSEDAVARSSTCKIAKQDAVTPMNAEPILRHPRDFAANTSAALFEKSCTQCHTWYRVEKVAARRSDWTATVDRMIHANGASSIAAPEREQIIQYLNKYYSSKAMRLH